MAISDSGFVFWCLGRDGRQLALIIKGGYPVQGVEFFTPDSFGQQVALMKRPKGELIPAHMHLPVNRDLVGTQEVLIMKKGRMRVDLFEPDETYVSSYILESGDIVLLNEGGHGFELLEESLFVEVKQGPYAEGKDKRLFQQDLPPDLKVI